MFPVQVRRLVLATAIIMAVFFGVRSRLVPASFGLYGHYRANSVGEIAALPVKYGGEEACTKCHAGIDEVRISSRHASIRCESCHGPSLEHALDPVAHPKPHFGASAKLCLGCHERNPTRPADFPQVDPREHRPGIDCVACHNPHSLEKVKQ
jgi:hypothetical protein